MLNLFLRKDDLFLASSRGAPQENDAKLRFAIHPQGIGQFHDNCQIAKCQTVATLAPVYQNQGNLTLLRASGDIGRQHIRNLHRRTTM